jgi:hypothetical protein
VSRRAKTRERYEADLGSLVEAFILSLGGLKDDIDARDLLRRFSDGEIWTENLFVPRR